MALQTRSLVTIARKGGQYLVTPTEAARYYREHDSYPPKLSVGATTSPVGEQAGSAKRHRGQRRPAAVRAARCRSWTTRTVARWGDRPSSRGCDGEANRRGDLAAFLARLGGGSR